MPDKLDKLLKKKLQLKDEVKEPERSANQRSQNNGLSPQVFLNQYRHLLSPFEQKEVFNFDAVYCTRKYTTDASADPLQAGTFTNSSGQYKVVNGDHLVYRYTINGTFATGKNSQVVKALDCKTKDVVAVKINNTNTPFVFQEAKMLSKVKSWDKSNIANCITLFDTFQFRGHFLLVLEVCPTDLKDLIEKNPNGLSEKKIKEICVPILKALCFFRKYDMIHGDLKPKNIRFNEKGQLKLCGFRYSTIYSEITDDCSFQTLHYRAPEVFCQGRATISIDMWSFGCIAVEMILGHVFLEGDTEQNQIRKMEEVFGYPPKEFFTYCKAPYKYFFPDKAPRSWFERNRNGLHVWKEEWINMAIPSYERAPGCNPLAKIFAGYDPKVLAVLKKCFGWVPRFRFLPEGILFEMAPEELNWLVSP